MIRMLLLALALALAPLAFALTGCSASQQRVEAEAVARATNAALPEIVAVERQEGLDAIHAGADKADAELRLAAVRKKWAPVWAAWTVLRGAHDAWATGLESGATSPEMLLALEKAWCDLRAAAEGMVTLPDVLACGGEGDGGAQ